MDGFVVFTTLEFSVILLFIIMIGAIALISSVGWCYESKRKDNHRKIIKDRFSVDYHTAMFGGKINYHNYMAELEKSIKRKGR